MKLFTKLATALVIATTSVNVFANVDEKPVYFQTIQFNEGDLQNVLDVRRSCEMLSKDVADITLKAIDKKLTPIEAIKEIDKIYGGTVYSVSLAKASFVKNYTIRLNSPKTKYTHTNIFIDVERTCLGIE